MKCSRVICSGILMCFFVARIAQAVDALKTVAIPPAEGEIDGAAFSPDSNHLAVLRSVQTPGAPSQRHIMQIVELSSGTEVIRADVPNAEPVDPETNKYLITYSADGRYLLLAENASDLLSIIDATTLHAVKRIALHPEASSRRLLQPAHHYFSGVVSLTSSSTSDLFGVLTHDESQDNEIFIGSFSTGQIVKHWALGERRIATQLGNVSLSLSDDGSKIAVSVLPNGGRLSKDFKNLFLYSSTSGGMIKSIRTGTLAGQIVLLPGGEGIFVSRIDPPGVFSKMCIEEWSLTTGRLNKQFCDHGRTVNGTIGASFTAGRVMGFASHIHKSVEGQVYAATGRVDVWDMKSGSLMASSAEIPRFVSSMQVSANGEWIMADHMLLRLTTAPKR